MAWQLVADVLDHAPDDLTSGELAVLVAIAEWARESTRETSRPAAELGRRTRLGPRGLQSALLRLARRELEVRVKLRDEKPSKKYPAGRPIYAVPGTVTLFRLPTFAPPVGCRCDACSQGHATAPGRARCGVRKGTPQRPGGHATACP